jgi:hypothetical protein
LLEKFAWSGASSYRRQAALSHLAKLDSRFQKEYERLRDEVRRNTLRGETAHFLEHDWNWESTDPVPELTEVLRDANPKRRLSAITLLCRHQGSFPVERVVELLNDVDDGVRANAVFALGLRGRGVDTCRVQQLVCDSSGLVRYCARDALSRLT